MFFGYDKWGVFMLYKVTKGLNIILVYFIIHLLISFITFIEDPPVALISNFIHNLC
jgi:hypothetical protein